VAGKRGAGRCRKRRWGHRVEGSASGYSKSSEDGDAAAVTVAALRRWRGGEELEVEEKGK
jgi:hypothetical protein